MHFRLLAFVIAALAMGATSCADEISVSPGENALSKALEKANAGDVVKLAAGEYYESVYVPAGVTIVGAGADKTLVQSVGYAAITCRDPETRLVALLIRGSEKTMRGVDAWAPVRVERCRFEGMREAVALRSAPLSDVIACDFVECAVGVRTVAGASPTIWECWFKGGETGIVAMEGAPYIRNNLFDGVKTGLRITPHPEQSAIIRNNIFLGCSETAIEILAGPKTLVGASIRNTIFDACGAAVIGPRAMVARTSHALVHAIKSPAFRDKAGKETLRIADSATFSADAGVTVDKEGSVTLAHTELLDGKGLRLCGEKDDAKGTIGLEPAYRRIGWRGSPLFPPVRWEGTRFIVNSVAEEYEYLKVLGRPMGKQALSKDDGVTVDRIEPKDGEEPAELLFDISRFFGEDSVGS